MKFTDFQKQQIRDIIKPEFKTTHDFLKNCSDYHKVNLTIIGKRHADEISNVEYTYLVNMTIGIIGIETNNWTMPTRKQFEEYIPKLLNLFKMVKLETNNIVTIEGELSLINQKKYKIIFNQK